MYKLDHQNWGGLLIIIGILVVISGILIYFTGWKWISWFGNLPGDIRIERGNMRIYFPIVSMLILSLVLTLILRLFR